MPIMLTSRPNADGPPIRFVLIWGLFATLMIYTHMQMATDNGRIAMGFQFEDLEQPLMMAGLD